MEAKSAQVVYASSGLKYTDPYTRCFLMNIAPGVTEVCNCIECDRVAFSSVDVQVCEGEGEMFREELLRLPAIFHLTDM